MSPPENAHNYNTLTPILKIKLARQSVPETWVLCQSFPAISWGDWLVNHGKDCC